MSSDERPADDSPTPAPAPGPAAVPDAAAVPGAAALPGAAAVPDPATLEQLATPARRRRAPKISAFITVGVLVGVVAGWVLSLLATGTTGEGRTGAILLTTVGLGLLGATVGAGLAAVADRRSTRGADRRARR